MTIAIKPRRAWNAGPNGRTNRGRLVNANLAGITVHWPGGGRGLTDYTDVTIAATLRSWQAQHRRNGWADIGYNFLIDGHGHVWEGCGWYRGAHAGDMHGNLTTVGVQLITGTNEGPTAVQIDALRAFRTDHVLTKNSRATGVVPHSHWVGTECPGDRIRALIKSGTFTQEDDMPSVEEFWKSKAADIIDRQDKDGKVLDQWTPASFLTVIDRSMQQQAARLESMSEVIKTLAAGKGLDPDAIEEAAARGAEAGMRAALESVQIKVTAGSESGN